MRRLFTIIAAVVVMAGSVPAVELIDAWNVDGTPSGGIYGYPANFAAKYVPTTDYDCTRIEFWGAGSDYFDDDQMVIRVETELEGQPSGEVLQQVTTAVTDGDAYWMGSDFPAPITLQAGTAYWVVFLPMAWSLCGWAEAGLTIETMTGADGIHWNPGTARPWMAKFWGNPAVAAEPATLSQVKALFD